MRSEGTSKKACQNLHREARHEDGTRAATRSQPADVRGDGSRSALAGGSRTQRSPDQSNHRLPLDARGSHARRSGAARWQAWTPGQRPFPSGALAGVAVSAQPACGEQSGAKRTARAVGRADQHQPPQRCSSSTWMEQHHQPGGKTI